MLEAVLAELQGTQVLIMAAAVADFRPLAASTVKIKKEKGIPEIRLVKTTDILAEVAAFRQAKSWPVITIGFAAESENLIENAQAKLRAKSLDMIVANDILASDAGFAVDTNRVSLLFQDGRCVELPLMSKVEVAERVLEQVLALLDEKAA
jgi:phosphopantothenoylcysteine decarboxylase/phosphopantothenate--cysteine ligase